MTAAAGDLAKPIPGAVGAAWGDFDNDGRPDLLVCVLRGPSRLFRNAGDGTFSDQTAAVGLAGRVFNLGGAPPASLLDLAERLIAANGGKGGYAVKEFPADRAPIDIGSYHADDGAFRAATGWAPLVGLDEGLRLTLDWYRARLADYV